jgi:hypothetical protein
LGVNLAFKVKVMKYHVEAQDNAKFLGSIEKCSHSIYLQVRLLGDRGTCNRLRTRSR